MSSSIDLNSLSTDWLRDGAFEDFNRLFKRSFGHPMEEALWRWKYRNANPVGSASWLDGQLVAFYGGMPANVRWLGDARQLVQIGDVMVEPSARGLLTRHGAFCRAATHYLTGMTGDGRPYHGAFGFPNERAMRLGERLGLYQRVGQMVQIGWAPRKPSLRFTQTIKALSSVDVELFAPVWGAMAKDLESAFLIQRDAAYIEARYLRHPCAGYRVLAVASRFTGAWRGVLVLRDRGDEGLDLVDVVSPLNALPLMIEVAREQAFLLDRSRLFCWLSKDFASRFAINETSCESMSMFVAFAGCRDVEPLRGKLWVMAGDTDFR